jgi:hypothetical protein
MEAEKNLQAAIPGALLSRAREVAEQEHIAFDELIASALEQRVSQHDFESVLAFGHRNARERGLTPSDIEEEIRAYRDSQPVR